MQSWRFFLALIVSFSLTHTSQLFADEEFLTTAQKEAKQNVETLKKISPPDLETIAKKKALYAKSPSARLYLVSKLMNDQQTNWPKISELLRQVLDDNSLDNDFARSRLKKVKQFVDLEKARQLKNWSFNERSETLSFLEARILVEECIKEMRPRLNTIWDGEVRYFKNMVLAAICGNSDEDCVIEFPASSTYSFDLYDYTVENIKKLMIAPGGKELEPAFGQFLVDAKKRRNRRNDPATKQMLIQSLSTAKDIVHAKLSAKGIDPNANFMPDGWDDDDYSDPWRTGSGGWGDDTDFGSGDGKLNDYMLYRVYKFVRDTTEALRSKRSIDDFEAYTLLMTALSNPDLLEYDEQLRDFMKGVQFKYRLAVLPKSDEWSKRDPKSLQLLKSMEQAFGPKGNVQVQMKHEKDQVFIYLVTNINGNSNLTGNLLALKNAITVIQTVKNLPQNVQLTLGWTAALAPQYLTQAPQKLEELVKVLNNVLTTVSNDPSTTIRIAKYGSKITVNIVNIVGAKFIAAAAEKTGHALEWLASQPTLQKTYSVIGSEAFARTLIGVSLALDMVEGTYLWQFAETPSEKREVTFKTGGKLAGTALYLVKKRPVVLAVAGFDIAHMIWDNVPSTSEIIEDTLRNTYNFGVYALSRGKSSVTRQMLTEYKNQLGIRDDAEAKELLAEFSAAINKASNTAELEAAHKSLSEKMAQYAARRMVFHYAVINTIGKNSRSDAAEELHRMSDEYDRIFWTWFETGDNEQMGLEMLSKLFDQKWIALGGAPRVRSEFKEPTSTAPKGPENPKTGGDLPWEDISGKRDNLNTDRAPAFIPSTSDAERSDD